MYLGPNIITDGLVLYLDATNTKSYVSASANTNSLVSSVTGSLVNGVGYSSLNNGSWTFDGSNDYIDNIGTVNDYNFIFSEGTFSISFWVKRTNNNSRHAVLGNSLTNTEKGWWVIIEYGIAGFGNNCLRFHAAGAANNTRLIMGTTDDNTIGTAWTHCVFTCKNPSKVGQWYINGTASNTAARFAGSGNDLQGNYYSGPSTRTLNIGRSNFSSTVIPLNGNVSQFSIYNRQLSADEVLQNYNATKTRFNL